MIVPIVKIGDELEHKLRRPCHKTFRPEQIMPVVRDLFDTVAGKGVGLSAPQIGLSLRIFVVDYRGLQQAFVNPTIIRVSENETSAMEGCLSIPGVEVHVSRPKMIWMDYWDENGKEHPNQKFRRMEARIIQHEYEHLQGILITDKRTP